ncbi:PAS domain S-box protein [Labilibaculum sp. K2S]|uniref:PAS domain S-box protein n=1 Tax=Labilibaculum sp. K2S TaxID=3056386 RepID=UPI0025A494B1|nr:PAS domain S-box protein [Labilibaculum sp. K2S]MDM8159109.1 PAS domain S-box protein [Labilibaculum sp. K2S]
MNNSMFLSLIQNTAILLSFSMLYDYLWVRRTGLKSIWDQLLAGGIVGAIGVVLMLSSWEMATGVVFDTRSVILSISGLFFGAIPTIIAILITGTYRFILGGEGMFMGIAVIISSGVIGILWKKIGVKSYWLKYLLLGVAVHLAMISCSVFLPSEKTMPTLLQISWPLLTIYPLGNMLLGLFMNRQLQNRANKIALSRTEEKYSRLYESMNDAFVVLDMDANVIEFNTAFKEMLGYSSDELLHMNCHDLTPLKWLEFEQKIMEEEVLVSGSSRVYEKECTRKDGSLIPVELRIYLLKEEKDKPKGFWVMVRDISLRKNAMALVENERAHLKILIETVPEMIWLKDPKGIYLSCNRNFEKFNGLQGNALIGKSDYDFYPREIADFYWEKDLEVLNSAKSVRFTNWAVSATTGNRLLTETIKTPMHDVEGKLLGVLGVSRDITDIKLAERELLKAKEKAEESDKLKSIFLANMSHEIRTPMNAIMGFSELLVDSELDDAEKSQYINIIQNSGNRLLQLIDDIVDISKLELDQVAVHRVETNLHELFVSSIEVVKRGVLLESKPNIELVLNLPEEYERLSVFTDSNRFHQILDNLLNNAIKFSEVGKVEVGYSFKEYLSQTVIEVYVKDEGCGIPKNRHDIIFERFRQGDEEQFTDGTGLGLSISKGLVELLGGEIRFESVVGKGSTFYFTLPYSKNEMIGADDAQVVKRTESIGRKYVLIAEEDYNSFLYLQKLFDGEDVIISHASNENIMINMLNELTPDLLILDMNIHSKSTIDCLSLIKNRNQDTKVIAQTAYAIKGEEERYIDAGCHGYITMPITKNDFLTEVRRVLN